MELKEQKGRVMHTLHYKASHPFTLESIIIPRDMMTRAMYDYMGMLISSNPLKYMNHRFW